MPWTYTVLCKRNARELFPEVSEITLILAIKLRTFGASIVLMPAKFRKQGDESTEMKFRGMRRNCINVLKDKSSLPRKYIQCISLLLTIVLLLPVARRSRPYATCTSPTMHLICAPPPPSPMTIDVCCLFLLDITAVPREIENNSYAKFWGTSKVHYGRCASGVWLFERV